MLIAGAIIAHRTSALRSHALIEAYEPRVLDMLQRRSDAVHAHGVKIVGYRNVPSRLAADASALFARNLYNFLSAFWDEEAKRVVLPDDDEIVKGVRLTQGGKIVNERLLA